jgi:hypothetical protein
VLLLLLLLLVVVVVVVVQEEEEEVVVVEEEVVVVVSLQTVLLQVEGGSRGHWIAVGTEVTPCLQPLACRALA